MAGGPTRDMSLHRRVSEMERECARLRRALEKQTPRVFQKDWPRDVKLAKTVSSAETYPTPPANTYEIELLDSFFTKAAGDQTATHEQRGEVLYAHDTVAGRYFREGEVVKVFWSRGLGVAGVGEWWIVDGPGLLVELCAQETATRNVPYDALLGTWNPTLNIWCYDGSGSGSGAPTVKAIDHRYGMPLAQTGWKGLYQPMPSITYGTIYVNVSLDCDTPPEGCNDCEES